MKFKPDPQTKHGVLKNVTRSVTALVMALASTGFAGCAVPRWPVAGTMTSAYGFRMRGWSPDLHNGVDVAAAEGTPVRTMKAGTVVQAGEMAGYGLAVIIEHNSNLRTIYGHLSKIGVKPRERVTSGQVIGNVGHTGNATGPHLHFEIWWHGRAEDPVPLLGGFPPGGGGSGGGSPTGGGGGGGTTTTTPTLVVTLQCNTYSLQRGSTISCSVSTQPSGATLSWRFDPSDGSLPSPTQTGGTTWGGTMVAAGNIVVTATSNGASVPASKSITVNPRSWNWGAAQTGSGLSQSCMDGFSPPATGDNIDIQFATTKRSDCKDRAIAPDSTQGAGKDTPPSGPNAGIWYVTSANYHIDQKWAISGFMLAGVDAGRKSDSSAD